MKCFQFNDKNKTIIMRVLAEYVLIEQIMTSKSRVIITDAAERDSDKFEYSFRVLQKGEECVRKIEVGEIPLFSKHVSFQGIKVISKDEKGMTSHLIVHENDIIGVDDEPEKIEKSTEVSASSN